MQRCFFMKNILVFFGGESVEHDVSIITGVLTVNSVDKEKYNAIAVYADKDGKLYTGSLLYDIDNYKNLNKKKLTRVVLMSGESKLYALKKNKLKELYSVSLAINCMHGERGEDGSLAGLLNCCGISMASPDVLGASISMSKGFTKLFLKGIGVKALPYMMAQSVLDVKKVKGKLKFPLIVKPDMLGSSIGISIAKDEVELKVAVLNGLRYGRRVIIEPMLNDFTEINCAVYRKVDKSLVVSECERPVKRNQMLSFKDKYESGERVFPADIEVEVSNKIKNITQKVYQALNLEGIIRIDFMIKDGEIYLNEINSVPGSLAYYLFGNTLKEFTKVLDDIIDRGLKISSESQTYIKRYNSGILKPFGSKGAKHL